MPTGWTIGRALLVGLLCLLGLTENSDAATREFSISGVVTGVDDVDGVFGGLIEVGTPYTSTFRYLDEGLRGITTIPNSIHYHRPRVGVAFSLTVAIDGYVFGTDPDGLGELTIDNGFRNHDSLWMSIGAVLSDEFSVHRIDLRLDDPSMSAFSMAALPSTLDLADFAEPSLTFTGSGLESFVYMDIQTLRAIPEPATSVCLLAGLALLSRHGRRRQVGAGCSSGVHPCATRACTTRRPLGPQTTHP